MRSLSLALTPLFLLTLAHAARADAGFVLVSGSTTPHDQDVARSAASTAFAGAGWTSADKPPDDKDSTALAACFKENKPAACSSRIAHGRAKWFALVNLAPNVSPTTGRSVQITARVIVSGAETVFLGQRFCDHCTDDTLASLVTEATKDAINQVVLSNGHAVLSVKSTPQRARFSVDGNAAGVTDAAIDVLPGPHTVLIESNGYEPATRTVNAVEGKTADVSVTLQPAHGGDHGATQAHNPDTHAPTDHPVVVSPPHLPSPPRPSRALPYALIGVGGLAIAGGVVTATVLDDDSQTSPRGQQQRAEYRETTALGLGIIAAGAAIAGVGVYRLMHEPKPATVPTVAPTNGGAVLGFSTSF